MVDNEAGAHLRIVPLDTGLFSVAASIDGTTVYDATVPATQLAEASAQGGRAVLGYIVENVREHAAGLTIGRLLGWE